MQTSLAVHTGYVFPDGRILLTSGDSSSLRTLSPTAACELFDPASNSLEAVGELLQGIAGSAGFMDANLNVFLLGWAVSESIGSLKIYVFCGKR